MTTPSVVTAERLSWALAGTAVLSALAFWRPSLDVFGYPKFAVLVFGIAVSGVVAFRHAITAGRLALPWGSPAWAAMIFGAAVLMAFVIRPTALAFIGSFSRHTGALFHLALVIAGLLAMRAATDGDAARWVTSRNIALGAVLTGAAVSAVGVLQLIGVDPLDRVGDPVVTATFGNPNFAAALVGATTPAAAWAAWDRAHGPWARLLGGVTVVAALATAIGTRSVQGPVTAAVGLLVFTVAVLLNVRDARTRRVAVAAWIVATAVSGALGTASLLGRGPLGGLADAANVELRSFYWSAGLRMFADNPVTGVGLERYGAHFGEFRSEAAAARLDLSYAVDAAHNVPIHVLATGGLFVGLAYLAFVGFTAVALARAFRRTAGRRRLLVGALGGIWAGYQIQSLVSIDTPPLALLHWLTAAAILAWSGMVSLRSVELPWGAPKRKDRAVRERIGGIVGAVALVGLFALLLVPLRAGTAAARGAALADAERYPAALHELETATERAPWEPAYWQRLGDVALRAQRNELAIDAFGEALEKEPRSVTALVTAARIAAAQGDSERASEVYGQALEVEPLAPTLLEEVATFFEQQGDADRADALRQRAQRISG